MASWLVQYGNKDRHIETALATFLSFLVAIWYVFYTGFLTDVPSLDSVVSSSYVSDEILAIFRTACAILSFVTLSWIVIDPKGAPDNPLYYLERKSRTRHASGITRLAAFTMWHFGLFGISFSISAACSWVHISGGDVPEWMLVASPALFATSYACAILVTFVVSFYIIGDSIKKGFNIDHLFYWYEIVMHNFNIILMGIAIILNNFEVDWEYFSLPIIFGIMYVVWARIYASIAGVYIYSFLDPRLNGAPIIHIILLNILVVSFVIVKVLELISNWNIIAGTVVITALNMLITTFKKPKNDY
ncbi:MAG: hypothetical protein ACKVI6_06485 [Candidatus Poseidoniales archaeon]|jgi:hypothetical protein|tara:strand:- start:1892 stop:2800 length:909 start_codon:yes stop_codon:yes gene_type:complete